MLSVHLQSSLIDLKEHASSLASSGLKKDSKLKSLEIAIEQKKEECSKLETQLQKVGVQATLLILSLADANGFLVYSTLRVCVHTSRNDTGESLPI